MTTNYIGDSDIEANVRAFGVQFDHPAGYAGLAPFPQAAPSPGDRLDERARVLQPARRRCTWR